MKKLSLQIVITGSAAVVLLLAFWLSGASDKNSGPRNQNKKPVVLPKVSVVSVKPHAYSASVTGYGEALPTYKLELSTDISGRVLSLSEKLKTGLQVKKGEVLLTIDDTSYQQSVASAEFDVAAAEVELLQQRLNRKQAIAEWKRSGLKGQPDSELVLYAPQVKAAQVKLVFSKRSLAKAKLDLARTQVKAPFDAQIISRDIELGSYVQAGSQVATLYNTDVIEVSLPLSEKQWRNLPDLSVAKRHSAVTLYSMDGSQQWQGHVARVEQFLNNESRQRSLVVAVNQPLKQKPALYSGTFVRAQIQGKTLDNLWRVPASAITEDQSVWYLSANNSLQQAAANVQFSIGDWSYVTPVAEHDAVQVVAKPLSSYLPDMQVDAININAKAQLASSAAVTTQE
ncbi:efflux transporter periplasmic adaptor subunit [Shewanella sp. OPT22]|nr:efflux transporter periplasmic adaptor subunit [Shewanella sp. OPT22]